jgi:tetratricopeptide (TPR) repeat protein
MNPFLFLFFLTGAPASPAELTRGQERLLHGNYSEARELFQPLVEKEPAAVLGLSRAWRSQGDYDKAEQVLQQGRKRWPTDSRLLAELADLNYLLGRWEQAQQLAEKALSGEGRFLAHWVLARLARDRGDLAGAGKELLWFVRTYNQEDISDAEQLCLIGQAACERARLEPRLQDQFRFVLKEIYTAVARQHPHYWPASYLAGALFLEKYDRARAVIHFDRALQVNPRAAEVLAAKAQAALQRLEVAEAADLTEQALAVNPRLLEALCLRADLALMVGDLAQARQQLAQAQAVNPRAEKVLGRLAACLYLERQEAQLETLFRQVQKWNSKPAVFYQELAERLEERRHYTAAEKYYQRALSLYPHWSAPSSALGLLYLRLGREEEGRKLLEQAFADDPYHLRVFNSLQVLDHLAKYACLETPHFRIRYDPKHDRLFAHYLAPYLEAIYSDLAEQFHYHPQGPFLIEIFPRHDLFSGRIVALPDLHTIGACAGRIVALVSPHDEAKVIVKPFNWYRVLRHEMTHLFNLDQTHFQVPHWLTEGLAVRSEQQPLPASWYYLLRDKLAANQLLTLENIQLGFVRPRSAEEWQQAYLQSYLYVKYLEKEYGAAVIGQLLAAYAEGLDTAAVLRRVCRVSLPELEKGYRQFLREQLRALPGRLAAPPRDFEQLKELWRKEPDNPQVLAQLAEQYLLLNNPAQAKKLAAAALDRQKDEPLACYVQAQLLLHAGQTEAALQVLEPAVAARQPEPKALKLLGKLYLQTRRFQEAAKVYELGRQCEPYEAFWLEQLTHCYRQLEQAGPLIETLKQLALLEVDNLAIRRELAQRLLQAGRPADAERYARQALEIDVLDRTAQDSLLEALRLQGKDQERRRLEQILERGS